jgi:hypothetical protein
MKGEWMRGAGSGRGRLVELRTDGGRQGEGTEGRMG